VGQGGKGSADNSTSMLAAGLPAVAQVSVQVPSGLLYSHLLGRAMCGLIFPSFETKFHKWWGTGKDARQDPSVLGAGEV